MVVFGLTDYMKLISKETGEVVAYLKCGSVGISGNVNASSVDFGEFLIMVYSFDIATEEEVNTYGYAFDICPIVDTDDMAVISFGWTTMDCAESDNGPWYWYSGDS
jgi:hypothetical protein